MGKLLQVTSLSLLVLGCASTQAQADHIVTLYNNSSFELREVYIGDFQAWDDLLKGRPDVLEGTLAPGESTQIQPYFEYCTASLIVTTEYDTVLVPNVDICGDELIITDDDVALDY